MIEIFNITKELNIVSVILGGLALPAYNVARSTIDIDISIHIDSQEQLNEFIHKLSEIGYRTVQNPKINHDLFTIFGKSNEAEIWLKPCDAFSWDDEMVSRRIEFKDNLYVLSKEDFILTKLARMDRSSVDIQDIIQILIANIEGIDWDYLFLRLKQNNLELAFKDVLEALLSENDPTTYNIIKNLIKRINFEKEN